ncbi:MAG: metal-dependent hydrolase, partial [Candidatus Hodarchaeota archaeon]
MQKTPEQYEVTFLILRTNAELLFYTRLFETIINMPPTGFHGIIGLLLCSRIDPKHKFLRIGLVWGSVLPDLDLLGSAFIFILTLNTDLALAFHRSVTHSLIVMLFIISCAYFLQLKLYGINKTYFPLILG